MPKKSRQAHVPSQSRKRKARRTASSAFQDVSGPAVTEDSAPDGEPGSTNQVQRRPRRRLDMVTQTREGSGTRITPGQLPIFERGYLVRELKQIGLISTALFALIILLALVLR